MVTLTFPNGAHIAFASGNKLDLCPDGKLQFDEVVVVSKASVGKPGVCNAYLNDIYMAFEYSHNFLQNNS